MADGFRARRPATALFFTVAVLGLFIGGAGGFAAVAKPAVPGPAATPPLPVGPFPLQPPLLPRVEGRPAATSPAAETTAGTVRIKDVADIEGVRENQLVGQGLVIGLNGTGDKSGDQLAQALSNLSKRFGLNVSPDSFQSKNAAMVVITATLPPFAKKGARLDVQVSSTGDAKSLEGGLLIQTPLMGADGRVYAVAQGALSVGGFEVKARKKKGVSGAQRKHLLVARIPGGALVEQEVPTAFVRDGRLRLCLRRPDFTTAENLVRAVNERWPHTAGATDFAEVVVRLPVAYRRTPADAVRFVAEVEQIRFRPDNRARVVINERTGTIVVGAEVRLKPTIIHHAGLSIRILPANEAGQNGTPTTISALAKALEKLGAGPQDIITIFQALKVSGALQAELIIM